MAKPTEPHRLRWLMTFACISWSVLVLTSATVDKADVLNASDSTLQSSTETLEEVAITTDDGTEEPLNTDQPCSPQQLASVMKDETWVTTNSEELDDSKGDWNHCLKNLYKQMMNDSLADLLSDSSSSETELLENTISSFVFVDNSKVRLIPFNTSESKFRWYPWIDKCKDSNCNDMKAAKEKAIESLDKTQKLLSNTTSIADLKFFLMPTIPWLCQTYGKNIGELLAWLWVQNNLTLQECGELICHSTHFRPTHIDYFFVGVNSSNVYRKCRNHAEISLHYHDQKIISLEILPSEKTLGFVVNKTEDMHWKPIRDFSVLHYAKNKRIKSCCDHVLDEGFVPKLRLETNLKYVFCYGTNETCPSGYDELWLTENVKLPKGRWTYHYTLVAIRDGSARPKDLESNELLQWLIISGVPVSLPFYESVLSLENKVVAHLKENKVLACKVKNETHEKIMDEIIQKLKEKNIECNETDYFNICMEESRYWIFLKNCSLSFPDDDKAFLLLLTYNFSAEISLNLGHLCQNTTLVAMTSVAQRNIKFNNFINQDKEVYSCKALGIKGNVKDQESDCLKNKKWAPWRFHYFMTYPSNLSKDAAIKQLISHRHSTYTGNENNVKIYKASFGLWSYFELTYTYEKEVVDEEEHAETVSMTMQLFSTSSFTNNTECIEDLSENKFTVEATAELQFVMGPIYSNVEAAACLKQLPAELFLNLQLSNDSQRMTVNKFWPVCSYSMLIAWRNESGLQDAVVDYDYLTFNCRVVATILFTVMILITLMTVIGNVSVLITLICTGLVKKDKFMIHTSLTIADLLLGLSAASLAVYDTYRLRTGSLTLYMLDTKGTFADFGKKNLKQTIFRHLMFPRYGWPVVSSIIMNISVTASMLILALFSVERVAVLVKHSFRPISVRIAICVIWVISISLSIFVHWRENGWEFVAYFDPNTKLTINIGTGTGPWATWALSTITTHIQTVILVVAGITIVICTPIAIFLLRREESIKIQTTRICNKKHQDRVDQLTSTFIMMVILFLASSLPIGIDTMANLSIKFPLGHFFAWWIFLGAGSWNWAIYCIRGEHFKEEAKKFYLGTWLKIRSFIITPEPKSYEMTVTESSQKNDSMNVKIRALYHFSKNDERSGKDGDVSTEM